MRRNSRTRPTKIITAMALSVAILCASPGVAGAGTGFGDVEEGALYADAVAWMVSEEITTGIEAGCFGPHDRVTRGQIAAFMYRLDRALGNEPRLGDHPFADVAKSYQREPVGWLYSTGVTTGTAPAAFSPEDPITRGDFATMLWRYAGGPVAGERHPFVDVSKSYQQQAVSWMAQTGITTGTTPTTFEPDGHLTRAQAATFLHRYIGAPPAPAVDIAECARPVRLALIEAGLTLPEATCAAPRLAGWDVTYLQAVAAGEIDAHDDWDLLITVALVGQECLAPERVADLTRIFL